MNRKIRSIILGSTVTLTLLVAASTPHTGREPAPAPHVRTVSAFTQADRVIPPPSPSPTPVGDKTANAELHSTPTRRNRF